MPTKRPNKIQKLVKNFLMKMENKKIVKQNFQVCRKYFVKE